MEANQPRWGMGGGRLSERAFFGDTPVPKVVWVPAAFIQNNLKGLGTTKATAPSATAGAGAEANFDPTFCLY